MSGTESKSCDAGYFLFSYKHSCDGTLDDAQFRLRVILRMIHIVVEDLDISYKDVLRLCGHLYVGNCRQLG